MAKFVKVIEEFPLISFVIQFSKLVEFHSDLRILNRYELNTQTCFKNVIQQTFKPQRTHFLKFSQVFRILEFAQPSRTAKKMRFLFFFPSTQIYTTRENQQRDQFQEGETSHISNTVETFGLIFTINYPKDEICSAQKCIHMNP